MNKHDPKMPSDSNPPCGSVHQSQPGVGLNTNLEAKEFDDVRGKINLHNGFHKAVGHWRKRK